MAPRDLESRHHFLQRLRREAAAGANEVRFGGHHCTHAACLEDGVWCVRQLHCSKEDAEAFMAEHGMFMPENAEEISKPARVLFRAVDLDDLERQLLEFSWPPPVYAIQD